MDMLDTIQFVEEKATSYATASDFCEMFIRETSSLYLLSLLLTGNHDKAEQCFIFALDECVEETGVVRGWATTLIRRAIIKRATRMIRPVLESDDNFSLISPAAQNSPFAAIRALGSFERFVFMRMRASLYGRALNFFFLLIGTVSFIAWARNREQMLFLWFAVWLLDKVAVSFLTLDRAIEAMSSITFNCSLLVLYPIQRPPRSGLFMVVCLPSVCLMPTVCCR